LQSELQIHSLQGIIFNNQNMMTSFHNRCLGYLEPTRTSVMTSTGSGTICSDLSYSFLKPPFVERFAEPDIGALAAKV